LVFPIKGERDGVDNQIGLTLEVDFGVQIGQLLNTCLIKFNLLSQHARDNKVPKIEPLLNLRHRQHVVVSVGNDFD